jgi:hypothetical protein
MSEPLRDVQVRLGVVQLLSRWIALAPQHPPVGVASANAKVLTQLADSLTDLPAAGSGGAGSGGDAATMTSAEQAVLSSGLKEDERTVFLTGQPVTAGLGALFVHDGQRLMAVAASVAALSAEALQAQVPCLGVLCFCLPAPTLVPTENCEQLDVFTTNTTAWPAAAALAPSYLWQHIHSVTCSYGRYLSCRSYPATTKLIVLS